MNEIIIDTGNYTTENYKKLIAYLKLGNWDYYQLKCGMNNLEELKSTLSKIIELAEEVIHQMPQKGDKCADCQRSCLIQAINEFSYVVNGIEKSDQKE